jgi:hypothetical protein
MIVKVMLPLHWILFVGIFLLFSVALFPQVIPWVSHAYSGDEIRNVECGENVIVAASLPFADQIHIFDNFSGTWKVVNLPQTRNILAEGNLVFAFSDTQLFAFNAETQQEDFISFTGQPLELGGGFPDVSYVCGNNIAMFITDQNMYLFDSDMGSWQVYSYNYPSNYNYGQFWAREDFAAAILFKTGNVHPSNIVYSFITKSFNQIEEGCSGSSLDYFFEMDHGFAGGRYIQGNPTKLVGYSAQTNSFSVRNVGPFLPVGGAGNYQFTEDYCVYTTYYFEDYGTDEILRVFGYDTRRSAWAEDSYIYPKIGSGSSGGHSIGGQISGIVFEPVAYDTLMYAIYNGVGGLFHFYQFPIKYEPGFGKGITGLSGGTVFITSDAKAATGYSLSTHVDSYINHYGYYDHTEIFAGENFATFCAYGTSNRMRIYFYHGPTGVWDSTGIGMKTGTPYSQSGTKYLFCLITDAADRETIFYSSLTKTYHKVSFPGGVIFESGKSDYLAFVNSPTGAYFFDANDGSLSQLPYFLHPIGLTNSAAITFDDVYNIAYGYNAETKTWSQTPISGNLTLPPNIKEYVGLIPVDSRRKFYAYSAKYDFWAEHDVNP